MSTKSKSPRAKTSAKRAPVEDGDEVPHKGAGTRAQDLFEILRQRIGQQDVAPGAKLREQDLALEFDVPRTLIREVFSGLEQRGLIERIPNRGAVVKRLDLSQVFHIYDTREVLEGLCIRLATQNAAPESWQDLVDKFDGPMVDYVAKSAYFSDRGRLFQADRGRRIGVAVAALGKRAGTGVNVS